MGCLPTPPLGTPAQLPESMCLCSGLQQVLCNSLPGAAAALLACVTTPAAGGRHSAVQLAAWCAFLVSSRCAQEASTICPLFTTQHHPSVVRACNMHPAHPLCAG